MAKVPWRRYHAICDSYLMHVLWRGPGEVQIGTDISDRRVLSGLTADEERLMLSAPRLTPTERERSRIRRGIDDDRWDELSRHLAGLPAPTAVRGTVVALDAHPITERVRGALERMGISTVGGTTAGVGHRIAVLTDSWITDPIRVKDLMAADVPHIPIVVEEAGTVVNAAVVPGATPCTTCIHLARAHADPKWPVVAPQLAQLAPRRLSAVEMESAAALAAHSLAALLQGRVNSGWYVTAERCLALAPPPTSACGCGSITPLYEDAHDPA